MKIMIIVAAALCVTAIPHSLTACESDPDRLGAVYQLKAGSRELQNPREQELILWRAGRRIGYEFPSSQTFDLWEETPNHRVRLERYFDEYQRGIEYEPLEVGAEAGEDSWQLKRQLIADNQLTEERLTAVEGQGCDVLYHYAWTSDSYTYNVAWLPERQLISEYRAESATRVVDWKLVRLVTGPDEVDEAFSRRDEYQTTDFVDIGDHENDTDLAEMLRRARSNQMPEEPDQSS